MKRFIQAFLAGLLFSSSVLADSSHRNSIKGTGARRDTIEFEWVEPSVGSAMNLIPGTDNTNSIGTSSLRIKDFQGVTATFGGAVTNSGAVTIAGNTTLGDALADTVTVNAGTMTVSAASGLRISTATVGGTVLIYIDGLNQRVGIGTASPSVLFHVNGAATLGSAITDAITFTGLPYIPANAAPRTNVTPAAAGALIRNSTAQELCFSTGTTISTWVRVSTPSLACQN